MPIKQCYSQWIQDKLVTLNPLMQCQNWTLDMQQQFPELTRLRGHILLASGDYRTHWWLKDQEGNIIDPTIGQFKIRIVEYIPWKEGSPEPCGKCMCCGEWSYFEPHACSEKCVKELNRYYNPKLPGSLP